MRERENPVTKLPNGQKLIGIKASNSEVVG